MAFLGNGGYWEQPGALGPGTNYGPNPGAATGTENRYHWTPNFGWVDHAGAPGGTAAPIDQSVGYGYGVGGATGFGGHSGGVAGVGPQTGASAGNVGGAPAAFPPDRISHLPDQSIPWQPQVGRGMPQGGGRPMLPGGGVPARRGLNPAIGNDLAGLAHQQANDYRTQLRRNQAIYDQVRAGYAATGQRQVAGQNAIAGGYQALANNSLGMLQPMQTALQQQQAGQQGIRGAYGQLTAGVMGDLSGSFDAERERLNKRDKSLRGDAIQSGISRGLNNTTVRDTMQRGITADTNFAYRDLAGLEGRTLSNARMNLGLAGLGFEQQALGQNTNQYNQIANAYSGLNSQLGLAGLGFLNQANQQNTALDLGQYGFMGQTQMPYPQAGQYAQLAQMAGQLGQAYA